MARIWRLEIKSLMENLTVQVLSCQSQQMVRCPRCKKFHTNFDNFGHEPEYLLELEKQFNTKTDSKELKEIKTKIKEKLCDSCVDILLTFFPEHDSIRFIRENLCENSNHARLVESSLI